MVNFPKATEYNKLIPKQKFYEHLDVSPTLKQCFSKQIKHIYWRNKFDETTLNVATGKDVTEIEVFEIALTQPMLDEMVLRQMDKLIPYHILFLLSYEGKVQAWACTKDAIGSSVQAFKVGKYYHTDWMYEDDLSLNLSGVSLDGVWESLIIQIGAITLEHENTLKEQITLNERREGLAKRIALLKRQTQREPQPSKKFQLAQQIKVLENELNTL